MRTTPPRAPPPPDPPVPCSTQPRPHPATPRRRTVALTHYTVKSSITPYFFFFLRVFFSVVFFFNSSSVVFFYFIFLNSISYKHCSKCYEKEMYTFDFFSLWFFFCLFFFVGCFCGFFFRLVFIFIFYTMQARSGLVRRSGSTFPPSPSLPSAPPASTASSEPERSSLPCGRRIRSAETCDPPQTPVPDRPLRTSEAAAALK